MLKRLLPPAVLGGTTDIRCFVMRATGASGVISLDEFVLDTPENRVGGTGLIDLGHERVDLVFLPNARRRLLKHLGRRLAAPIAVQGSLATPNVTVNPVGLAVDVAVRAVYSPVKALEGIFALVIGDDSGSDHPCRAQ